VRWLRIGLVAVIVISAVGLVVSAALGDGAVSCPASLAVSPTVLFVGEVTAKDGAIVTFRVVEPLPYDTQPDEGVVRVGPDDRVEVTYDGGDQRFLHTGERYQVLAYGSMLSDLRSGVHTAGECDGVGSGTSHAGGSAIDTGIFTRDGIDPYLRWIVGGLVVVVGGVALYRWRMRVRHPRLPIHSPPGPVDP